MPIFLLRHGQSKHNVKMTSFLDDNPDWHSKEWWEIEDAFDPKVRDAELTEKGILQARSMREDIASIKPSLLILSPLSRNLQTAHEACCELLENKQVEVKVTPLAREHTYSTCDLGSSPHTLKNTWPQWSSQLGEVIDEWWMHNYPVECSSSATSSLTTGVSNESEMPSYREPWQHLQDRVESIVKILTDAQAEHECILLVGHAVLFYAMTGKWLDNCQLSELDLSSLRPRCACTGHVCLCDEVL